MRIQLTLKHGPTAKPALLTLSDFGNQITLVTEAPDSARTELTLNAAAVADLVGALLLVAGIIEREFPRARR